MITLHLGIYEGDVKALSFNNRIELVEYILEIKKRIKNRVWLLSNEGETGNIFITEKLDLIELIVSTGIVDYEGCSDLDGCDIHLHEYECYEDAYKVATDMREGNPLCYS